MAIAHKNLRPLFQDTCVTMEQSNRVIKSQLHHYRQIQHRMTEALKVLNTKYQAMEKSLKAAKHELKETKETLRTVQQYTQKQKKEIAVLSKNASVPIAGSSHSSHCSPHANTGGSSSSSGGGRRGDQPSPPRHPYPFPPPQGPPPTPHASTEGLYYPQQPQMPYTHGRAASSSVPGSLSQEPTGLPPWMAVPWGNGVGSGGRHQPTSASRSPHPSHPSQQDRRAATGVQDHHHRGSLVAPTMPLGWSSTSSVMMGTMPPLPRKRSRQSDGESTRTTVAEAPPYPTAPSRSGLDHPVDRRHATPSPAPVPPTPSPLLSTPLVHTIQPQNPSGTQGVFSLCPGNGASVAPSPLRELLLRSSTMLSSNP